MSNAEKLYMSILRETGRDELTDAEICTVALLIQRELRQGGEALDLGGREGVNVDTDV